ncbi:hypothetical protein RHSIM_Rhsim06G0194700 [Rhododendron simsii]|uniref:Terpene synthase metal-binding domain-containing protein n=1 Tax=Rhododendron simsii TaxID=118357 RepID=A0A834LJ25_RHOSS|nr:hypothetical protein RHSIM_Rhsim06G0194700 [Rhododendron simsii]
MVWVRWWKDLDVAGKLPFARDRLVEMYFWILGVYEPHYILAIRNLTKVMCLTSIIDDMYDASNATIEELVLFNDAIQRWKVSALDQLPDYMKLVYQTVLDTFNIIEDEMAKQGRSYGVEYAKSALKDLVGVYCKEAKCYHEGYVPSMDEHWPVALLSCGYQAVSTMSFTGMGELATKEAFDWVSSNPLIVQGSSVICRLIDDVVGHKNKRELRQVGRNQHLLAHHNNWAILGSLSAASVSRLGGIEQRVSGYSKDRMIVHDTAVLGCPNMSQMTIDSVRTMGADAIVNTYPAGSRDVVNAYKTVGIAAFGPIWDS